MITEAEKQDIQAFLDGELDEEKRQQVRKRLQDSLKAQAYLFKILSLDNALKKAFNVEKKDVSAHTDNVFPFSYR